MLADCCLAEIEPSVMKSLIFFKRTEMSKWNILIFKVGNKFEKKHVSWKTCLNSLSGPSVWNPCSRIFGWHCWWFLCPFWGLTRTVLWIHFDCILSAWQNVWHTINTLNGQGAQTPPFVFTVIQSNGWQNILVSFWDCFLLKVCYWYFPAVLCCYSQYFALWFVSKYSGYILLCQTWSSHSSNRLIIALVFWHHPFLQHNISSAGKNGFTIWEKTRLA